MSTPCARLLVFLLLVAGCGGVYVQPLGVDGVGADAPADAETAEDLGLADATTRADVADVATADSAPDAEIDIALDVTADSADTASDATATDCSADGDCVGKVAAGPCQTPRCEAGLCVAAAAADGTPCGAMTCAGNGSQAVLQGLLCQSGTCGTTVMQLSCQDALFCTLDACDAKLGCTHTASAGACEDGNACTLDSCDVFAGCQHTGQPGACDDGDPCTSGDACEAGHCVGGQGACPCAVDGDCKFLDPCHPGACQDGLCVSAPKSGAACNDGDPCTGGDTCDNAATCGGTLTACDDGIACTIDMCSPKQGCVHVPDQLACSDGDPCTADVCDALGGCVHKSVDKGACDDGDACTSGDGCKSGKCVGNSMVCADLGACQIGVCEPATGMCKPGPAADGSACDDGNVCSLKDNCLGGTCVGKQNPCDDGNACTVDICAADGGCKHEPQSGSCDIDATVCTQDLCTAGTCAPGKAVVCNDANPCTTDSCNSKQGCTATALALGTPCGSALWCNASKCVGVPVPAGMVYVAGGAFTQGCNVAVDNQCSSDEKPAHAVQLSSFFVGKTEVTAGQYAACVQSGACSLPAKLGAADATYGVPGKEQFPVAYVSWGQAVAFCLWSGGQRLCTEAEWEFAARGTDGRRYPWGNSAPTCEQANFTGCAKQGAQAVGASAKGGSPVGALDMAGNVREWVADWYAAAWYGEAAKTKPTVNPKGPATGTSRVLRGGYYMDSGPGLRTSARSFAAPGTGTASVGIRCCKSP